MLTQASHFCRMFMNNLALMFEKYFLLINELLMTSNTQWRKNGDILICTTTRVLPITISGKKLIKKSSCPVLQT